MKWVHVIYRAIYKGLEETQNQVDRLRKTWINILDVILTKNVNLKGIKLKTNNLPINYIKGYIFRSYTC